MKIRKLGNDDIPVVVELWYETSVSAHDFISPDYWKENRDAMATQYLPNSETYLAVEGGYISGFVSMVDNYLAALFVKENIQGSGIGTKMLNHVQQTRSTIELKVYKKNSAGVNFYKKRRFKIISESKDENTGEIEYVMKWEK